MEHAQRVFAHSHISARLTKSLNPYFNGTCSKSQREFGIILFGAVLILILMEHAQRVINSPLRQDRRPPS